MKTVKVSFQNRESITLRVCNSTTYVVAVSPFDRPTNVTYRCFRSKSTAEGFISRINADLHGSKSSIGDLKYYNNHLGSWKGELSTELVKTDEEFNIEIYNVT